MIVMCCSHCLTVMIDVFDLSPVVHTTKGGQNRGKKGTRVGEVRRVEGTTRSLDPVLQKSRQLPQAPMLRRGDPASRAYDPPTAIDITPSEGSCIFVPCA